MDWLRTWPDGLTKNLAWWNDWEPGLMDWLRTWPDGLTGNLAWWTVRWTAWIFRSYRMGNLSPHSSGLAYDCRLHSTIVFQHPLYICDISEAIEEYFKQILELSLKYEFKWNIIRRLANSKREHLAPHNSKREHLAPDNSKREHLAPDNSKREHLAKPKTRGTNANSCAEQTTERLDWYNE